MFCCELLELKMELGACGAQLWLLVPATGEKCPDLHRHVLRQGRARALRDNCGWDRRLAKRIRGEELPQHETWPNEHANK